MVRIQTDTDEGKPRNFFDAISESGVKEKIMVAFLELI
jgi:hypothetical protein